MNNFFFLKALKNELKDSGITYRELAKILKLSEAGVKKLLNKNDISMGRARQICHAIGISLADVLNASEESYGSELKFTDAQVLFFGKNPHYFNFYMRLVYEQKVPKELFDEMNLTEKSLFKYLKKLDDLELIKLHPQNRISFLNGGIAKVNVTGTALEKLKNKLTVDLIHKVESTNKGSIFGGIFYLSQEENASLEKDLKELSDKYTKRSISNRNLKKKNKSSLFSTSTAMITLAPYSLFGEIKNID